VKHRGESGDVPHRTAEKAQNERMPTDSWWAVLAYPALFCIPWVIAIVWVWRRTTGGDGMPAPSMGELARRRLKI